MLVLQGLQHDCDELNVGVTHSIMYLVRRCARATAGTLCVGDLFLQLAGVLMDALQEVRPDSPHKTYNRPSLAPNPASCLYDLLKNVSPPAKKIMATGAYWTLAHAALHHQPNGISHTV